MWPGKTYIDNKGKDLEARFLPEFQRGCPPASVPLLAPWSCVSITSLFSLLQCFFVFLFFSYGSFFSSCSNFWHHFPHTLVFSFLLSFPSLVTNLNTHSKYSTFILCVCINATDVCVYSEARRGPQVFWSWSYRHVCATSCYCFPNLGPLEEKLALLSMNYLSISPHQYNIYWVWWHQLIIPALGR